MAKRRKEGRTKHPFNDTIIRDGWIVKIRKDGRIKAKIERYLPNHKKG
jgi:hypothetical protein